jgi:hypothetical protein
MFSLSMTGTPAAVVSILRDFSALIFCWTFDLDGRRSTGDISFTAGDVERLSRPSDKFSNCTGGRNFDREGAPLPLANA